MDDMQERFLNDKPHPGHGAPHLLIHLTDTHLLAEPHGAMLGVDTQASLQAVLHQAMREMPGAKLLLVTGDLAQDGSTPVYRRLRGMLEPAAPLVRCLPGNHDDGAALRAALPDWTVPVTDLGAWRIVMLDSTIAGADAGHLDEAQLALLDRALDEAGGRHVLVALHHNLVQTEAGWRDAMMVDNPQAFFERLARRPAARLVLWGHVHRPFDCRRQQLRMLATPSTCFQFTIRDGRHQIDEAPPGYRWLKLYDDGSFATGVRRLDATAWAGLKGQQAAPQIRAA